MITGNRRYDVAWNLRAIHSLEQPLYGTGDHQRQVRAEIGGVDAMKSDKAFLEALIDLIDPTCTVSSSVDESDRDSYFQTIVYTCSECGASWTDFDNEGSGGWAISHDGDFVHARYCPYCGARILTEECDV